MTLPDNEERNHPQIPIGHQARNPAWLVPLMDYAYHRKRLKGTALVDASESLWVDDLEGIMLQ